MINVLWNYLKTLLEETEQIQILNRENKISFIPQEIVILRWYYWVIIQKHKLFHYNLFGFSLAYTFVECYSKYCLW
jgi:hypothetical protein